MTKERMNIHKALSELKVLDDRIFSAMLRKAFVLTNKHSNKTIEGVSIAEAKEGLKSNYQKVNDLIARRNAIKRAVIKSNATTIVTIAGVDYTVAEAIEMKNHGLSGKKELLKRLVSQKEEVNRVIERNSGEAIERKSEEYVLSVIQAQPKDSKMSIDSEAMKKLRAEYIANNSYDILDPNNVSWLIEKLDEEISAFESDVDATLSTSNATTIIEFEY